MELKATTIINRMNWIDWAKAIAITLVVFGHIHSDFMSYIFSFHMPFFLMLSGFLQKKRPLREEMVKSAKSLLAPYVIYNLYLLIYSIFTGEYTADYPWSMAVGLQWNLSMACRPLWFLLALFWMRFVYAALPIKGGYILAIACMLFTCFFAGSEFMTPMNNYTQFFTAIICFPFFIIGTLLRRFNGQNMFTKLHHVIQICLPISFMIIGLLIAHHNGFVNLFRCTPGDIVPLFYLSATFTSVGLFLLIRYTLDCTNSFVQLVSEGTLIIFALHQSILWPLRDLIPQGNIWALVIAMIIVTGISGLAWLSRRYCPVLIGKWK